MRNIMGQCHALRCIAAAGLVTLALWLGATGLAASAPQLRSFPIPTRDSQPIGIALGPDGNLWFTESRGQKVARITPSGVITEFALPGTFPGDIIAGPDEAMWFTEGATGRIGRITPAGKIREVEFSTHFDAAGGITTGPDGNIWFTDSTGQKVWRLNLATQGLTSFPLPSASFPGDITTGADGNLWFTDAGTSTVDRLTPAGGLTEFGGGQLDIPYAITTGPDGNVWFTERFAQRIDRITPSGVITAFTTPGHTLDSIAPGLGNTLLFTEFGDSTIATITTAGVIAESPTIDDSGPEGICRGPDHTVWFVGFASNRVYRLAVP